MEFVAEKLIIQLRRVLADSTIPVTLTRDCASRDDSLSQGLSGVLLALSESDASIESVEVAGSIPSIFHASIDISETVLTVAACQPEVGIAPLRGSDIFNGPAAEIWTAMTLMIPVQHDLAGLDRPTAIVRPGLGHGALGRQLALSIAKDDYFVIEEDVPPGGWCNGSLGVVVAMFHRCKSNEENLDRAIEVFFELLHQLELGRIELDSSICHGVPGVVVVGAALTRMTNRRDIDEANKQLWSRFLHGPHILAAKDRTTIYDFSWLTGVAGIVWADAVVKSQPLINPLVPWDSKLHARAGSK